MRRSALAFVLLTIARFAFAADGDIPAPVDAPPVVVPTPPNPLDVEPPAPISDEEVETILVISDPFARWDGTRWFIKTEVGLPISMTFYADQNYEFFSNAFQIRTILACDKDVDGQQGALQLLAFDVLHDLALLKPVDPAPLRGRGAVPFRPADGPGSEPERGARIYSLGNPLDVGFAVTEGAYNGLAERHYLPTLFFGGSLSGGMSGGPALDAQGRLVGVNVAARRDGEQVSFLVPAALAQALLARGRDAAPITQPVHAEIERQLLAAPGRPGRAVHRPALARRPATRATASRCRWRPSRAAGAAARRRPPAAWCSSAATARWTAPCSSTSACAPAPSPCATKPTTAAAWARCASSSATTTASATKASAAATRHRVAAAVQRAHRGRRRRPAAARRGLPAGLQEAAGSCST